LIGGFAGAGITHAILTKGWMPLSDMVDIHKVIQIFLFIFLAPFVGMFISIFFSVVFVSRNTWLKSAILLAASVGLWFLFQHFQETKINENIAKYFKVDKYKKEMVKDATRIKSYHEALANAAVAEKFVNEYEKKGGETVAENIIATIDKPSLKHFEVSILKDKVKKFLQLERLKILAAKNEMKNDEYMLAQRGMDSIAPLLKKYHEIGYDSMMIAIANVYPMSHTEIKAFKNKVNVDVKADLMAEMSKANNKFLRWFMIAGLLIFIAAFWWTEKLNQPSAARTGNMFKRLQLLSSAAFSIGHGGNDAQKVMGIIAAALVANGDLTDIKSMPDWIPIACYTAIGLGTLSGGWKIIKTMGTKITKVSPLEGVCAETAGATTLFLTEQMGIPVSTTHTITGAIIGAGATKRLSAVRWGVTINLLWAWVLTIPISGILAAIVYWIVSFFLK
jgi:phosphate/sulfate permease